MTYRSIGAGQRWFPNARFRASRTSGRSVHFVTTTKHGRRQSGSLAEHRQRNDEVSSGSRPSMLMDITSAFDKQVRDYSRSVEHPLKGLD